MQLHWLTETNVSIITGQGPNGCDVWQTYRNSLEGRAALAADCPPDVVAEVMAMWGDAPTVEDVVEIEQPTVTPAAPTTDQRLAAVEEALLAVMAAQ